MIEKIKAFFGDFSKKIKKNIPFAISVTVMILAGIGLVIYLCFYFSEAREVSKSVEELKAIKERILLESELTSQPEMVNRIDVEPSATAVPTEVVTPEHSVTPEPTSAPEPSATPEPIVMLPEGAELYEINNDFLGWLTIPDTEIDYPVVMEKAEDENYYLKHWFDGSSNKNGTLFTLSTCEAGVGKADDVGKEGFKSPTTNILIFGHNQKSGMMFGTLDRFLKKDFCDSHSLLYFDTAYEHRVYKLVSVFRSHVFNQNETDFKYYYFFDASNEEEFDYWLNNIKEKSEVELPNSAKYGDEFITLSTCSDTNEFGEICDNGRLAVVFLRIE